jgi:hypothetical protein
MLAQTLNEHTCAKYIIKTEAMLQWIKEKL